MQGKITLITPPDIFENSNESILFMHLTDDEQDRVSKWLGKTTLKDNINIYLYITERIFFNLFLHFCLSSKSFWLILIIIIFFWLY
jgi:hypothetical protein